MPQLKQDAFESGSPGNAHGGAERQSGADPDEQQVLGRISIEMSAITTSWASVMTEQTPNCHSKRNQI